MVEAMLNTIDDAVITTLTPEHRGRVRVPSKNSSVAILLRFSNGSGADESWGESVPGMAVEVSCKPHPGQPMEFLSRTGTP